MSKPLKYFSDCSGNFVDLEEKRKDFTKLSNQNIVLKDGVYQMENMTIKIEKPNYKLYFCKNLVSTGIWQRKDGYVILEDAVIHEKFKLKQGKDSMKSLLLPGDFKGLTLRKLK